MIVASAAPERIGTRTPERVVVVRALPGLGDLLCAVPALRALRGALRGARITLLGLASARPFVTRFVRYVDDLLEFPGYPGIAEASFSPQRLLAFVGGVQARGYDLAIQMHGNGMASNAFTALLGARHVAGYYLPGQYCPDPERFLAYPAHEPEVRRHLGLMEFLGIPPQGEHLEFPLLPEDAAGLEALPGGPALASAGPYVVLHPGATLPSRRWPPERFAAVGDVLARRGYRIVVTGIEAEAPLTAAVTTAMHAPALDAAGRTTVGALGALLARSALVVVNDTGVSHLAAAIGTPSVVVFRATEPERWAPLDHRRHRALGRRAWGNPCRHVPWLGVHRCLRDACTAQTRALGEPPLADVSVEQVCEAALGLLEKETSCVPFAS